MQRRQFLVFAGGLLAMVQTVIAQESGRSYRMGWVAEGTENDWQRAKDYVLQGILAPAGFVSGRNLVVESRIAGRDPRLNDAMLAELSRAALDVIAIFADPEVIDSLKRVAPKTPIVVLMGLDAVNEGLIRSLAHPGGNITGVTYLASETLSKRMELLKEIFPATKRARLLTQKSESRSFDLYISIARQLGIGLRPFLVESIEDLNAFFTQRLAKDEAVYVGLSSWNLEHASDIVHAVNRVRAPAVYPSSQFVDSGGLATYQADLRDAVKRLGEMTLLVLRGRRPAEIPFEQTARFRLILNQRTARASGVVFPSSVLLRADRVIE